MIGNSRESLQECWEALLDVPVGLETFPHVRQLSGGLPGCPGLVGRPYRMSVSVREALPNVREWSRVAPGCPGVVGRPSRLFGTGREALPNVREWLGVSPT